MKSRKRRIIRIVTISLLGAILVYWGGGIIATLIVDHVVYAHRTSNPEDLQLLSHRISYTRADYPILETREIHDVPSGNNILKGYLYQVPSSKGLVLCAHGMSGQSDDENAQYQQWFVGQGYSVFALDLTGAGRSGGNGPIGLAQSAYDVASAYRYLVDAHLMQDCFYLIGHSWGAYGVTASLGLGVSCDGIITFAAFEEPETTMLHYARRYVGDIANVTYPPFALTHYFNQGQEAHRSASAALRSSSARALIFQSDNDKSVPLENSSLYDHVDEGGRITKRLLHGKTHSNMWRSDAANAYRKDVIDPLAEKLNPQTEEEIEAFLKQIDRQKAAELDEAVFEAINAFLSA